MDETRISVTVNDNVEKAAYMGLGAGAAVGGMFLFNFIKKKFLNWVNNRPAKEESKEKPVEK